MALNFRFCGGIRLLGRPLSLGATKKKRLSLPLEGLLVPSGCVYVTPPGWKTPKVKNSRTCMMNLGIGNARSRIGTKNLSGWDNLITLAKFPTFLDSDRRTCVHWYGEPRRAD